MQEELEDRYGNLPRSVQLLLEVVLLKAEAHALGITAVTQKHGNLLFAFRPQANIDPAALMQMLAKGKGKYLFTAGNAPYLTAKPDKAEAKQPLQFAQSTLRALQAENGQEEIK